VLRLLLCCVWSQITPCARSAVAWTTEASSAFRRQHRCVTTAAAETVSTATDGRRVKLNDSVSRPARLGSVQRRDGAGVVTMAPTRRRHGRAAQRPASSTVLMMAMLIAHLRQVNSALVLRCNGQQPVHATRRSQPVAKLGPSRSPNVLSGRRNPSRKHGVWGRTP